MKQSKQRGFLSLMTIFIIVLFTLLSAGLAYLFISRTISTSHMLSSNQAMYLATSGIEQARYVLNQPTLSDRSSCAALNQNFSVSNSSASISAAFINQTSMLDGAINSSTSTITLTNSSSFSNTGRIYIDNEAIDYKNNDIISNQLTGITRGQVGTLASSHNDLTIVSQFQCYVQSTGTSPMTHSAGQTIINMANQSQTAVSVGDNQRLIQWDHPTNELSWQNMSGSSNNVQYNAVSLLNAHQGFAVGNVSSDNFSINQLDAGTWSSNTFTLSGITSQNLNGVSTISSQDAWAVGHVDGSNTILLHWNGSNWSNASNNGSTSSLNDVKVIDTTGNGIGNFGFAVGNTISSSSCSTDFYQCYANPIVLTACQSYVNNDACYTTGSTTGQCSKTGNQNNYNSCLNENDEDRCQRYIENCTEGNGPDSTDVCANNYYQCQSNGLVGACQLYIGNSTCYSLNSTTGQCRTDRSNSNYQRCLNDNRVNNCLTYIDDCTDNIITGGGDSHSEASILQFDGSNWTDSTVNNGSNITTLNSVSIITNGNSTPIDAYAVGGSSNNNGVILQWNGSDWSILASPSPSEIMHAISMIDTTGDGFADYGWVVGDNGNAYEYNNGLWSNVQVLAGGAHLYGVKVLSKTDAWVVGANGSRYHWNGNSWSQSEGGVSTTDTLRAIDAPYSANSPSSGWRELIN